MHIDFAKTNMHAATITDCERLAATSADIIWHGLASALPYAVIIQGNFPMFLKGKVLSCVFLYPSSKFAEI